jgi:hypothetical protein
MTNTGFEFSKSRIQCVPVFEMLLRCTGTCLLIGIVHRWGSSKVILARIRIRLLVFSSVTFAYWYFLKQHLHYFRR